MCTLYCAGSFFPFSLSLSRSLSLSLSLYLSLSASKWWLKFQFRGSDILLLVPVIYSNMEAHSVCRTYIPPYAADKIIRGLAQVGPSGEMQNSTVVIGFCFKATVQCWGTLYYCPLFNITQASRRLYFCLWLQEMIHDIVELFAFPVWKNILFTLSMYFFHNSQG